MATRSVVLYDDFDGGEWGDRNAWKAEKNQFTANNMLVYSTGELGVRAGLVERTPAGVPNGEILGFGSTPVPAKDAWFVIGNNAYTFDILVGNNLLTATGTMSGTATSNFDVTRIGTDLYITAKGKTNSYRLRLNTGTGVPAALSVLTGSPSARAIVSYGDRLVLGDITGSLTNRIRFSDALNYFSWPSANFIDIGADWFINGLLVQRQHLVIAKQVGFFVLTGVPGVNPVIRKISGDHGPLSSAESAMGQNDLLYNWPTIGHFPAAFNGSRQIKQRHLDNFLPLSGTGDTVPTTTGVTPLLDDADGAAWLQSSKAIVFRDGVFTYHTFGVTTTGLTAKEGGSGGLVTFCDGGGVSSSAKFYVWDVNQDRPGIEGSTHDRAGDASDVAVSGSVTFPEWWAPNASEFRVRAVIVDFRKWNTGASNTNHFDLKVDMLRRYNNTSPTASNTVSFDEAPASASASGTLDRRIFGFGEQGNGNGFQIVMTNCRGIAIQRIEVILDMEPVRV